MRNEKRIFILNFYFTRLLFHGQSSGSDVSSILYCHCYFKYLYELVLLCVGFDELVTEDSVRVYSSSVDGHKTRFIHTQIITNARHTLHIDLYI